MSKKETRKEKWQRVAKEKNIKFQENDTISMLVTLIAHEVGVNPKNYQDDKDVEKAVDKSLAKPAEKPVNKKAADDKKAADKKVADDKKSADKKIADKKIADKKIANDKKVADKKIADDKKVADKKVADKKIADKKIADDKKVADKKIADDKKVADKKIVDDKKVADKKAVKVKPPAGLNKKKDNKNGIVFPDFKNIRDMKAFCISVELHKVAGFIDKSKKKKTEFLEWMIENKDKAVKPVKVDPVAKAKETIEGKVEATTVAKIEEVANPTNNNTDMIAYGNSILSCIRESFQVRIQGGLPIADLHGTLARSSKEFTYEVKSDGNGKFVVMTDAQGNTNRIPSQGYLPVI